MDKKKYDYAQYVWVFGDRTTLYKTTLEELLDSGVAKIIRAKDVNDYARMEIGTNYLCRYIVQLVNDVIDLIASEEGREESREHYKEQIGLGEISETEFKKRVVKNDLTTEKW